MAKILEFNKTAILPPMPKGGVAICTRKRRLLIVVPVTETLAECHQIALKRILKGNYNSLENKRQKDADDWTQANQVDNDGGIG